MLLVGHSLVQNLMLNSLLRLDILLRIAMDKFFLQYLYSIGLAIHLDLYQLFSYLLASLHLLKHHGHRLLWLLLTLILLRLNDLLAYVKAGACAIGAARYR